VSADKKKLGKILLRQRLVTPEELEGLLHKQRANPGSRLASTAQREGAVGGKELLKALSEQHGLPGIDLAQVVIPLENLRLVPAEIARQHLILPVLVKEDRIFLAMADPDDRRVIDEIEFVTGRRVFPYVALHDSLSDTIRQAYRLLERGEEHFVGAHVSKEYLASLGLAPNQPTSVKSEPPSRPTGVVMESGVEEEAVSVAPDDDLGIAELQQRTGDPFGSQVAPLPEVPKRKPNDKPRVLVVDDEDDIRKLLKRVLQQKGYDVVEAGKGLEALQLVRDENPDVILLDAMLPEVHGFDICRRIKGSKRYGHIPIIMVSAIYRGWRVAEDLKTSYGVDAFLEKPFKIGDILSHVERALSGRAGESSAEDEDEMLSREAGKALEAGMDLYRQGDMNGAIAKLREGLGIDPLSFQLHYHLGLLCGRRDEIFEAIHELETAVDLQPRNFSALKNLAVLYQRAGFKHKAIEMWERALSAAPDEETRVGIKEHLMSLL